MERTWFLKNNYQIKTFFEFVNVEYENDYPSHSFLIYQYRNGNWNWFENADFNNRGIHSFKEIAELLDYQYQNYLKLLKTFAIKGEEIDQILITELEKPKSNIGAKEYLEHVIGKKENKVDERKNNC